MKKLGFIERFLTLWIFIAIGIGLTIGTMFPPDPNAVLDTGINLPMAVLLILMMYPPLAKVEYKNMIHIMRDVKAIALSLIMNWIIGPILMFVLAFIFLHNHPDYMMGVIMIGLARCIAMVLVWSDIGNGNKEYTAALVALNSLFQIFTYSFLAWLFITYIPRAMGYEAENMDIPMMLVAQNVAIYLGIPFAMGLLSRIVLIRKNGLDWYDNVFVPRISPITLIALLITIIYMFSLKGSMITSLTGDVALVSMPLICYFVIIFIGSFVLGKKAKIPYDKNLSIAYTATGNNFELAIAIAIAVFGINSAQALAGVIGPLIEVPVLILLVNLANKLRY